MRIQPNFLFWLIGLVSMAAQSLLAAEPGASEWVDNGHVEVRLITADAPAEDGSIRLGTQFRMDEGWKIYWRSPGDAGYPPRFDWSGSVNLRDVAIDWPAPERFSVAGFETLGYHGEVVLPLRARLPDAGGPADVHVRVEYMTCKEICIPYEADLNLSLPAARSAPSSFADLIGRYEARVPTTPVAGGIEIVSLALEKADVGARLVVAARSETAFISPDLIIEGPRDLVFTAPRTALYASGRQASFEVAVAGSGDPVGALEGRLVTLTLTDGGQAVEIPVTIPTLSVRSVATPTEISARSLLTTLGVAFLGGLILNLMPCVLPVLSLKLLGLVRRERQERTAVRRGFVASSAGIIVSFIVLGSVLAGLKVMGASVGWGIQFQHPWFLTAMIVLVTLFACNLWGLIEFGLPRWAADLAISTTTTGLSGNFATGALTTLLATPCSAPFVGTAVGFALAAGPVEILAVFAAMGAGLAAPHLIVAVFPSLAFLLPRPGRWMGVVRFVLGSLLLGTAIWLLMVLAAVADIGMATWVAVLVGVAAIILAVRRRGARTSWAQPAYDSVAVACVVAAFVVPAFHGASPTAPSAPETAWHRFAEDDITALVQSGMVVFVDVTAEWCLTCKVNEKLALSDPAVRERLTDERVIAMRGDWTRPDARISAYMARYGRYGVPFNAVYGPGCPNGLALPELLTPGVVTAFVDDAFRPGCSTSAEVNGRNRRDGP